MFWSQFLLQSQRLLFKYGALQDLNVFQRPQSYWRIAEGLTQLLLDVRKRVHLGLILLLLCH